MPSTSEQGPQRVVSAEPSEAQLPCKENQVTPVVQADGTGSDSQTSDNPSSGCVLS